MKACRSNSALLTDKIVTSANGLPGCYSFLSWELMSAPKMFDGVVFGPAKASGVAQMEERLLILGETGVRFPAPHKCTPTSSRSTGLVDLRSSVAGSTLSATCRGLSATPPRTGGSCKMGCEFLYDESHGRVPPLERLLVYQIPVWIARWLANPARLDEVGHEGEYLAVLADDIAARGIVEPLELIADPTHIRLQEGHHRVLAAESLELAHVPVRVAAQRTRAMKGHRRQLPPGGAHLWLRLMEQL